MSIPKLLFRLLPMKSVSSKINKDQRNTIRRKVYQKANYTCEICGAKNIRLECLGKSH